MQRTNIYLDEGQIAALDRLAEGRGVSRAEIIRVMINRGLSGADRDVDADLAGIEASFGALGEEEIEFERAGDDARSRHLAGVWAR